MHAEEKQLLEDDFSASYGFCTLFPSDPQAMGNTPYQGIEKALN
jgi:hypothetical protein